VTAPLTNNGEAMALPVPPGLTLLPHQQEGIGFAINRLRTNRGAMFGDVMGLGKTIEAIVTANAMGPSRILVVCPASVLFTWRREIWKWQTLGLPVFLIQAGCDTTINHGMMGWGVNGWYIINYDILGEYPEIKTSKPWDFLILDESHKLKNPEAIRTQHVFGSDTIAPIPAEKALLLTGTPMINYVHDLYTQLHYLDPAMWPSFEQFVADQYFPDYKIITPSQIVGDERNLERLRRQLKSVMIRRPKSVLNLPPKEREIFEVDVEDSGFWSFLRRQAKCLSQLQQRLMRLLDGPATEGTRAEIRCLQEKINRLTNYVRYQVGMNKLPAVIEYLKGCTGKTLVFAYHHDVIERLVEALGNLGVSWFTGGSSLKDRDRAAKKFQGDPNCRFFIGNIEAAGQGITLTAAGHVVFAEPDWRGTYLEQAEDRAHRIGQTHPVLVTYLLLKLSTWSTDSWIESKTRVKQIAIDTVLGSSEEENSLRQLAAQRDWKQSRAGPHKDERWLAR
jgi:SWI/SNF-related matrix-associated actin-dependent regulator of chromatin subfamily A-like protein 1